MRKNKYTVSFHQAAVVGIPDKSYPNLKEAAKAANEFITEVMTVCTPARGFQRSGSAYQRHGMVRVTHRAHGTEAWALIAPIY